jgi:hypothetical protein
VIALLYFATAGALLALAHRFFNVTPPNVAPPPSAANVSSLANVATPPSAASIATPTSEAGPSAHRALRPAPLQPSAPAAEVSPSAPRALRPAHLRPFTLPAAIVLLLLPLVFTGRAILRGMVYAPIEMPYITQPLADHRGELHVPPPHNGALVDIAFQMIPWREAVRRSYADHQWPLLNRFILCGDVLAGSMQAAPFSPFTLIACLLPAAMSFSFTGAIAFFIAGLGAFLLARELGAGEMASVFAAVGWMFSAQLALTILWPLGFAWAFLPLVLAAAHRGDVGTLTVALTLQILAGHPETTLHIVAIAFAFSMWRRRPGQRIIAAILALLITAIATFPFIDALHHSGEYKVRQAFAREPLRLPGTKVRDALIGDLFPFARGGVHFPLERAEGGSILLAVGIAGLISVRRKEIAFFGVLLAIAFLAGINGWPIAQLLHRLPIFDAAFNDRLAAAVPLCLAILGALAFQQWPSRRMAATMIVLAIIIAIAAVHWPLDRQRAFAELVPLVIAAIAVALVRKEIAAPALIALLLIQRTISDGSLIPTQPRGIAYPHLALFDAIDTRGEPFRIAPLGSALLPNTPAMYGLEDARGNTPMTLASYGEILPLFASRPDGWFLAVTDLTRPILSMMNVRYSMQDVSTPIPPGWRDVKTDIYTRLIENEHVLPRAFVPAHVVLGSQHELEEMSKETDFAQRAWISSPESGEHENGPGLVSTTDGLNFTASMDRDGFVVISQSALPGWRAYLDGRRVKLLSANHAFLAVFVPAGEHRLRLAFLPKSFVIGRAITFATLLGIIIFLFVRLRSRAGNTPSGR